YTLGPRGAAHTHGAWEPLVCPYERLPPTTRRRSRSRLPSRQAPRQPWPIGRRSAIVASAPRSCASERTLGEDPDVPPGTTLPLDPGRATGARPTRPTHTPQAAFRAPTAPS